MEREKGPQPLGGLETGWGETDFSVEGRKAHAGIVQFGADLR